MKDITIEEAVKTLKDFCKYGLYHNDNTKHNTGKAIEKVLDELESEKEYHQWDVEKLQDYHKENSELNTKCVQLEYQLEKKDKMINAMALQLSGISIWDNQKEEPIILVSEDAVKEYYERKVKYEENK